MDADEAAWLDGVARRLAAPVGQPLADAEIRTLLRVTKVTADSTGVRYLAPLTAFLIGRAVGAAEAGGRAFDLREAAEAISELAAGWPRRDPPAG